MRYSLLFLLLALVVLAVAVSQEENHSHHNNHGHKKGHGSSSSSSSSEESHEKHKKKTTTTTTKKPQKTTTTTTRKTTPAKKTKTTTTTTTRRSRTTTTTKAPTTTTLKSTCSGSVFPKTKYQFDDQLVYNPNIQFNVWSDEFGCDWMNMTCSGYYVAELTADSIQDSDFIYTYEFGKDNQTLITISYKLPWMEFGWGGATAKLQAVNNTFYCMVGSLTPVDPMKPTSLTTPHTTNTKVPPSTRTSTCSNSLFPQTKPKIDLNDQLVYNPNIQFQVWTDESGCDWMNMTCSGYYYAELTADSIQDSEFIYTNEFGADNQTLVTVSYKLPWLEFGWGGATAKLQAVNNTFYCMVGSLTPINPVTTPTRTTTTTSTTTTTTATTTTSPSTTSHSIPSSPSEGPSCECDTEKTWVDLILLFDASASSGPQGLQQMFGYAQTTLSWFNVQKSTTTEQFHTRVGIVTYGSSAQVVASLGSINGDELESMQQLPYKGDEEADIQKAIDLAVKQFETKAHRSNARRVIALFATSYDHIDAPTVISDQFVESNGVLFVYNYIQGSSIPSPKLQELASPGYYFTHINDQGGDALKSSLCNANCYCQDNYVAYKVDPKTRIPVAGCYYSVNIEGNFGVASKRCQRFYFGYLAEGKTAEKTTFLQSQFEIKSASFWSGLAWDTVQNQYLWVDGTSTNGSSYQPWAGNHQSGLDCVAVVNDQWTPSDCRKGYEYICEVPACDSNHYCEDEV